MPKKKSYSFVYRGILVSVNEGYAGPNNKSMSVVVHFPDIERYYASAANVKRSIDKFLSTYVPNHYPF